MKNIFIILLFIFIKSNLFAQNSISGKIQDEKQASLPFVNIVLYEFNSKKMINADVSNNEGNYLIKNIPNGNYFIEVSCLGFKDLVSPSFSLFGINSVKNFKLIEDEVILNAVVVTHTRPKITQNAEKLVVDLEKSAMVNSNIEDVIKKVPGIIISNGNITYGGQQGVSILLNGKKSNYIDISSLLHDFPADNISKVELIQQPGAEFDAEGAGVLINIIMKNNVKLGTNGSIKIYGGYDNSEENGISMNVSKYKDKLNWQLGAGYRRSSWRDDLFIDRKVKKATYRQATITPYQPISYRANLGSDYYISEQHSLGVDVSFLKTRSQRTTSNITNILNQNFSKYLITENSINRNREVYNISPSYKFQSEDNKVSFIFDYVRYNNNNVNDLYKVNNSSISYNNHRYKQDSKYEIITSKADYEYAFNENFIWMLGIKYSKVATNSKLKAYLLESKPTFEPNSSNSFLVDEEILALYLKMSKKWKRWMLSCGLRWEDSETIGTSGENQEKKRKVSRIFPSANIGASIGKKVGLNLSYSHRISRPSYNSLNSFVHYYDPYTLEKGNPNLKSEFTNNLQFNLTYEDQPFFSINYRKTDDALFELVSQNDSTAQTYRSEINLRRRFNWNFKIFAPLNFVNKLNGYTGLIANYNNYESEKLKPKLKLSKWSFTWYTNIQYKMPWKIDSEITGYYTSGGLQGQIEHDWLAGLEFATSKAFLNDKLKINIGIKDILNRKFKGSIVYKNIDANIINDWSRQNVYIQLTFRLGGKGRTNEREKLTPSKAERERFKDNN